MPTYRPVRTTGSAVPDALAALRSDVASLSSVSSGQINGTSEKVAAMAMSMPQKPLAKLAEQIRVTPVVYSEHGQTGVFTSPPKLRQQLARIDMNVPIGKTRAQIMCGVYAQLIGASVQAQLVFALDDVAVDYGDLLPATFGGGMTRTNALRSKTLAVKEGQKLSVWVAPNQDTSGTDDTIVTLDVFAAFTS